MKVIRAKFAFFATIALVISVSYNNCSGALFSSKGSGAADGADTVSGNPLTRDTFVVMNAICDVLTQCNSSLSLSACQTGISAAPVSGQLGAAASYPNFSAVAQAEQSGVLSGDTSATNTCVAAVSRSSCSVPTVQSAYISGAANPFAGVASIIPAVCGGVFSKTYEYIYLGDKNVLSLPGYSINTSSGVLTPIPNPALALGQLSVGKISGDTQVLFASGWSGSFSYWINPTTGILTPLKATGIDLSGTKSGVISPSGNSIYASTETNGWNVSISTTAGLVSANESAYFSAPITQSHYTLLSPDGKYVYFFDPTNSAIAGYYATSANPGGIIFSPINGTTAIGNGANAGDKTYGFTRLPAPGAGSYTLLDDPYIDTGAGVIYIYYLAANTTSNNWVISLKINADGSLGTGTPLNLGTNPAQGDTGAVVGDSGGKFLFVALPGGTYGVNTYSIGSNGSLTYVSGPAFSGLDFYSLAINPENNLLYGNSTKLAVGSINMATGTVTSVSSVANPCGNEGPMSVDPSERFVYTVNRLPQPNTLCGFTVNSSGVAGAITGQSYPMTITGSSAVSYSTAVQMSSPQ